MSHHIKIIAGDCDIRCLIANRERTDAPAVTYGVMYGFGFHCTRPALMRRYGLWPSDATLSAEGYARLKADLAAHPDAQALGLSAGEFFGLQISAWRNKHMNRPGFAGGWLV